MEFVDHEQGSEAVDMELGPSYDSVTLPTAAFNKMASPVDMAAEPTSQRKPRYRECLKNHAVNLGGHAVDGCGEFLPAGPDGTLDALKCAACNCHRNFHRREALQDPFHFHHHQHLHYGPTAAAPPPPLLAYRTPSGYLHVSPQQRPLALPSSSGGGDEDGSSGSRKRFRTKFTAEQKQKMVELAEKLEWKVQRQDEEIIQAFCNESGIKRHVLKVWMHNNKSSLGKKP